MNLKDYEKLERLSKLIKKPKLILNGGEYSAKEWIAVIAQNPDYLEDFPKEYYSVELFHKLFSNDKFLGLFIEKELDVQSIPREYLTDDLLINLINKSSSYNYYQTLGDYLNENILKYTISKNSDEFSYSKNDLYLKNKFKILSFHIDELLKLKTPESKYHNEYVLKFLVREYFNNYIEFKKNGDEYEILFDNLINLILKNSDDDFIYESNSYYSKNIDEKQLMKNDEFLSDFILTYTQKNPYSVMLLRGFLSNEKIFDVLFSNIDKIEVEKQLNLKGKNNLQYKLNKFFYQRNLVLTPYLNKIEHLLKIDPEYIFIFLNERKFIEELLSVEILQKYLGKLFKDEICDSKKVYDLIKLYSIIDSLSNKTYQQLLKEKYIGFLKHNLNLENDYEKLFSYLTNEEIKELILKSDNFFYFSQITLKYIHLFDYDMILDQIIKRKIYPQDIDNLLVQFEKPLNTDF